MAQTVSGMTHICEKDIPFSFDREKELFTLYTGIKPVSIPEELDTIVGQSFGMINGGIFLYKLYSSLSNNCTVFENGEAKQIANCDQIRSVEYCVEGYQNGSRYTEMRLCFPELDYFLPSAENAKRVGENLAFSMRRNSVFDFSVNYRDTVIAVSFDIRTIAHESVKATAETISEVILKFPETDNWDYIVDLYYMVRGFFAFICNRQNIGLRNAILIGNYPTKTIRDKKIVDTLCRTEQKLFFSQEYLEPIEDMKQLKKVPRITLFVHRLKELFQLFIEEKDGDIAIVSERSIHPSIKYRNLIDLKQSLHITAAFEYYVRIMLPEISSQTTIDFMNDIEALLSEYIEKVTGKKKKKATSFKNSLRPQISLEDKILKAYKGYGTWQPLLPILSEWFGEDISGLASTGNLWRNDLAHEKREYEPNEDVIFAIRLIEHMNYSIILRHAGYCDAEIKAILTDVLSR